MDVEEARRLIDASEGVIFDNDGTLVDTMPVYYRGWQAATKELGLTLSERKFYSLAGKSPSAVLSILNSEQGKSVAFHDVQAIKARVVEEQLSSIEAIMPVVDLVHYAKQRGKRVAVASGGHRTNVHRSLKAIGFSPLDYFDAVVTAEDVTNSKPHPETFLLAAKLIGVDPERCVGFEDGDLGLKALHAAKISAVDVRLFAGYPVPEALKESVASK